MHLSSPKILAVLAVVVVWQSVWAMPIDTLRTSSISVERVATAATRWQITPLEWMRYQKLMQGPAGRWYRDLSPPEVLGIFAKNAAERQRFADRIVQQRAQRIQRELALNAAVSAAWKRAFPRLKPIRTRALWGAVLEKKNG